MNPSESSPAYSEPTEAGTFPPMRNAVATKEVTPPESTVDYRNHNLVAALFSDREQAIEAVQALRKFSRYTPTAIGVSSHLLTPYRQRAVARVVAGGLLGGLLGGLAALSQRPRSSGTIVLAGIALGTVVGSLSGALLSHSTTRDAGRNRSGHSRRKSVLVKVRARDLGETATILQQHHGHLRTGTGAPFPSVHPEE